MIMQNMEASKATRILARTMYKEFVRNGFSRKDIINFSKEILDCLAADLKNHGRSEETEQRENLLIG